MSRPTPRLTWLLLAGVLACEAGATPPTPPPVVAPAPAPTPTPTPTPAPVDGPREAAGVTYLERIHVPPGTAKDRVPAPDAALPMVIAIHGRGDTPEDFQHLLDDVPATFRLIVPRAFDPLDGGWSWFPYRARSPDVDALARAIGDAGGRLAALVTELRRTRPTVGRPILTGFSQGGMLSFTIAATHPDLVGAAVPVGGWLPPPLWPRALPAGHTPAIDALHGEADAVVRFTPTREAVEHLEQLGWPATLQGYPEVGHAIPPPMRRELHLRIQRAVEAAR
jgi:phospholipase/carboxylesterase